MPGAQAEHSAAPEAETAEKNRPPVMIDLLDSGGSQSPRSKKSRRKKKHKKKHKKKNGKKPRYLDD